MYVVGFYLYDFDIMSMQWDGNSIFYFVEGLLKFILKMEVFDIWMNYIDFGYIYVVYRGFFYIIFSRIVYDYLIGNMYWIDVLYNWIVV